VVSFKVTTHEAHMGLDDLMHPPDQVVHPEILSELALQDCAAALISVQLQRILSEGLAGYRTGMDTGTADVSVPLDHRHTLARLGSLNCSLLTGRPAADDQNVVVV